MEGPWSPRDRELAKALVLHEAMTCDGCGMPAHEAQDPDREGWYNAEPVICAGCLAIAKAARDNDEPGVRYRVSLDPNYVRRS